MAQEDRYSDEEELDEEDEDEDAYSDEIIEQPRQQPVSESAAPAATGEVCVEKPLSVKEQIKNFANLKIQELLGPQAVAAQQLTPQQEDQSPIQQAQEEEEEEEEEPEEEEPEPEPEEEEYDYSVASEEPPAATQKPTVQAAPEPEKPIVVTLKQPSPQQIKPSPPPPASVLQPIAPVQAPVVAVYKERTPPPVTSPAAVATYRPPEPAPDPLLARRQPQAQAAATRVWKSGPGVVQINQAKDNFARSNNNNMAAAAADMIVYLGPSVMNQHNPSAAGSVSIALRRQHSDKQWGFRIYGGTEAGCPPFVNHVSTHGIAFQMGLEIGDVVLAICGMPTQGKSLSQVKAEILRAGNELDFTLMKHGIDLAKLIQKAPQLVPQLVRGSAPGSQPAQQRRIMPTRAGYNNHHQEHVYDEPNENGGTVSGQGIRPVQTRSLRILEQQLAKGISPGSAVQSKQHFQGARGLASSGENSSFGNVYGTGSNRGYGGRQPNHVAPQPHQSQQYCGNANNVMSSSPSFYEDNNPHHQQHQQAQQNFYNSYQQQHSPLISSRVYPAYAAAAPSVGGPGPVVSTVYPQHAPSYQQNSHANMMRSAVVSPYQHQQPQQHYQQYNPSSYNNQNPSYYNNNNNNNNQHHQYQTMDRMGQSGNRSQVVFSLQPGAGGHGGGSHHQSYF